MTTEQTRSRSFANSGLTYEKVARELGVVWCRGCKEGDHEMGYPSLWPTEGRAVHWRDRRMTRRGLRLFLVAAAPLMDLDMVLTRRWIVLYEANRLATKLAEERFGVRFPRSYADRDRARVRLWMKKDITDDRVVLHQEERRKLRRIKEWAKPKRAGVASRVVRPATPTPTETS